MGVKSFGNPRASFGYRFGKTGKRASSLQAPAQANTFTIDGTPYSLPIGWNSGLTAGEYTMVVGPTPMTATVKLWGAGGGLGSQPSGGGGGGGYATGTAVFQAGSTYKIIVGTGGGPNALTKYGGGNNGDGVRGGGGGYSGIFVSSVTHGNSAIIAGGGGAGGGPNAYGGGGGGGGTTGGDSNGPLPRGLGGTQSAGGAGGTSGVNGSALTGGGGPPLAGGGGGYYGGGSGSDNGAGSPGGGGGSGYTGGHPSLPLSSVSMTNGTVGSPGTAGNNADPLCNGAGQAATTNPNPGTPGRVVIYL